MFFPRKWVKQAFVRYDSLKTETIWCNQERVSEIGSVLSVNRRNCWTISSRTTWHVQGSRFEIYLQPLRAFPLSTASARKVSSGGTDVRVSIEFFDVLPRMSSRLIVVPAKIFSNTVCKMEDLSRGICMGMEKG